MADRRIRQKAAPRAANARIREQQALELRLGGASYRAIGTALGISAQAAHKAVMRALTRIGEQSEHDAVRLRTFELERLERLIEALWQQALSANLCAMDRLLKAIAMRHRLLGLYPRPPEAAPPSQPIVIHMLPEDVNL